MPNWQKIQFFSRIGESLCKKYCVYSIRKYPMNHFLHGSYRHVFLDIAGANPPSASATFLTPDARTAHSTGLVSL